jgi:hypothetical protein
MTRGRIAPGSSERVRALWCVTFLSISLCAADAFGQPAAGPPSECCPPAEDTRTQYPGFLLDSYFQVSVGDIRYDFSRRQLQPGIDIESVETPPIAARVVLFGHEFNRFVSAQISYLRPVQYVIYRGVNGDGADHHLFVHFGTLTLKPSLPVSHRVSLYGEAGVGVTSRRPLQIGELTAVVRTHYAAVVFGGGGEYRLTDNWSLTVGAIYFPGSTTDNQPHTVFVSGGFRYTVRRLPEERVEASRHSGALFPVNLVQLEYTTGYGYGVNTFLSQKIPVFWGGSVKAAHGLAVHYERNVFHTRKIFALDFGASVSYLSSREKREPFAAVSMYPLFRFTVARTKPADLYVVYSLAGPTFLSRPTIDDRDTGTHFTFQDFMGLGVFVGKGRRVSAGAKINHYSNGNIFTENAAIKVPITLQMGYTF